MPGKLEGKTAIITGGSRGIGRAIVELLSAQGAHVFFTYLSNKEAADQVTQTCTCEAIPCDGTDREAVNKAVEDIKSKTGSLDILINNAGIAVNAYFAMMKQEDWTRVMDTNVNGCFNWAKAVIRPMMIQRSGAILNLASVSGLFGVPGQTAYGASKGAIISFTRALAAESGTKGIRVNCLVPGFIETAMTSAIPSPIRRKYKDGILMKRFGNVNEVAKAALFLVSEEASYITGQVLVVDGGLSSVVA